MLSTDPLRLRHTHHRTHVSEIWTKTCHAVESGRLSRWPDRLQSSHIIWGTHDRAHLYQSRERRVRSIVSVLQPGSICIASLHVVSESVICSGGGLLTIITDRSSW